MRSINPSQATKSNDTVFLVAKAVSFASKYGKESGNVLEMGFTEGMRFGIKVGFSEGTEFGA